MDVKSVFLNEPIKD
jgi:hypothetical protein